MIKTDILDEVINNKDSTDIVSVEYKTSCYLCFRRIKEKPLEYKKQIKYDLLIGNIKIYFHKQCLDNYIHFKEELKKL